MKTITITGEDLTIEQFIEVTRNKAAVALDEEAEQRIERSRKAVEELVAEEAVVYGLTTGFGSLASVHISKNKTKALQENLLKSHACGVGKPLPEDIVRGILLLRINTFAKGYSGIKLKTVRTIIDLLNKQVYPVVPEQGSVGSSGDLAPLSHLFLPLIGLGECFHKGKRSPGKEALAATGIETISLSSKEGLALTNGTPVMTSIMAHAVHDAENAFAHNLYAASMTLEALKANSSPFREEVQQARGHQGQQQVAKLLRILLKGSELIDSNKAKVQDAYSLRATAVVLGASLDTLRYVKNVVQTEMNAATDNPLIFGKEAVSAANFHGQPIALVADFLGIAMSEIGNLAERRMSRVLDPCLNDGLPAFLVQESGVNNGFMIPQYTAAALINENKTLCHPNSVDSIPTCANQEDHVSMGTNAARKTLQVIKNVQYITAIELLIAAQALDMRTQQEHKQPGTSAKEILEHIRKRVPYLHEDRELGKEIEILNKAIDERKLIKYLTYRVTFH